ncbi:hypothetical protein ACFX5D_04045 [Flavobacterium sp. LB3P45]|uniref:Uncharacterized protein n=1 Tax=Flavobacterium fructosi TaxID=3230416 RepID=A0ABW6HK73_9FLAO
MKKIVLLIVVLMQTCLFAQATQIIDKPLKLSSVSKGTANDSILLLSASRLVKYIPVSELKTATNLNYLANPTGGTVFSSTGSDAFLPLATATNAGLFSPAEKTSLGLKANIASPTFTGSVIVPDATLSTQAVNKGQLDIVSQWTKTGNDIENNNIGNTSIKILPLKNFRLLNSVNTVVGQIDESGIGTFGAGSTYTSFGPASANVHLKMVRSQANADFTIGNPQIAQAYTLRSSNYFGTSYWAGSSENSGSAVAEHSFNIGNSVGDGITSGIFRIGRTRLQSTVAIKYATDISASYDARTLIDKGYLDARLGASGGGDMVLASIQTISGLKTFLAGKFGLRNIADTSTSFFTNTNTANRTYTLQDRDGILLDDTDLASLAPKASPIFTGSVTVPDATLLTQAVNKGQLDLKQNINSTYYIGTTANALNRTSAIQNLTGVNIDGSSFSTSFISIFNGVTNTDFNIPFASTSGNIESLYKKTSFSFNAVAELFKTKNATFSGSVVVPDATLSTQAVNKGQLDLKQNLQIVNDIDTASISNVGKLRYYTSGNISYVDMSMQIGSGTYAWVNIIQNIW